MQTFLTILLILAAIATVVMLVRGIVAFLRTKEAELHGAGPSLSSQRQNKMMMGRIFFQAIAVLLAALLLMLR